MFSNKSACRYLSHQSNMFWVVFMGFINTNLTSFKCFMGFITQIKHILGAFMGSISLI